MDVSTTAVPTVVRTERGLSIAGTRLTLYDVMDYLTAGWPPGLIADRLGLSERQISEAVAYIEGHRSEVEAEYESVLEAARESRAYWEEQNRERLTAEASQPPPSGDDAVRARLQAWKSRTEKNQSSAPPL